MRNCMLLAGCPSPRESFQPGSSPLWRQDEPIAPTGQPSQRAPLMVKLRLWVKG
jgi:hypothetical protein